MFLKIRNIISKIKRSKLTDYAALMFLPAITPEGKISGKTDVVAVAIDKIKPIMFSLGAYATNRNSFGGMRQQWKTWQVNFNKNSFHVLEFSVNMCLCK